MEKVILEFILKLFEVKLSCMSIMHIIFYRLLILFCQFFGLHLSAAGMKSERAIVVDYVPSDFGLQIRKSGFCSVRFRIANPKKL